MRQIHKLETQEKENDQDNKEKKNKKKDHCSSSSTIFDWIAGTGNDSSWFGDARHGSNGIVSFSWFGLLVICWCSIDGSLFDDVDGWIGVKNNDDGDDELWIDGKVESN